MDENTNKRIHLLIAPAELAAVDRWRSQYPALSQSDAINRLIDLGLGQVAAQSVPVGGAELAISDGKTDGVVPIAAPDQAFLDGIRGRKDAFKGKMVLMSEFQIDQIKQLSNATGIPERRIIEDAVRLYMIPGGASTRMAP